MKHHGIDPGKFPLYLKELAQDPLLVLIVVEVVEVPEFFSEVTQRTKFFKSDEFSEECLVISFDLATASGVIRSAKDEFDTMLLGFLFEQLRD